MRTTLKRGVGRTAGLNGKNGHAVFPPAAASTVVRYRQQPQARSTVGLVGKILLIVLLTVIGGRARDRGRGLPLVPRDGLGPARALPGREDRPEGAQRQPARARGDRARRRLRPAGRRRLLVGLALGHGHADPGRPGHEDDHAALDPARPRRPDLLPDGRRRRLGVNRINSAYADCGSAGTVDTVKHLTGLPINYLITVNFHGFKEIVDKLGGIWLDVDRRYYHVNNGSAAEDYANINIQPGYQLLSGAQALEFVRYRHTDDDYHRIARQQEFVEALKEQFEQNFSVTALPSIISTIEHNVEVGGNPSDTTVLSWALFCVTLPGGHFFQDQIQGITGSSMTSTSQQDLNQAWYQFTHPDVGSSQAANAAALGTKAKPKAAARGTAGREDLGARAERQRRRRLGRKRLLRAAPAGLRDRPAAGQRARRTPPRENYFHTQIYYDNHQKGSQAAARSAREAVRPGRRRPAAEEPARCGPSTRGRWSSSSSARRLHGQLVALPPAPTRRRRTSRPTCATTRPPASTCSSRSRTGPASRSRCRPCSRRAPHPDDQYGDVAARLYWIDKGEHAKAVRLVFVDRRQGEYWGIEETDMPNPPILADRSFQHEAEGPRVPALLHRARTCTWSCSASATAATGSSTRCSTRSRTRR